MKLLKRFTFLMCLPLLVLNTTCDDDDMADSSCGVPVVIDNSYYEMAVSSDFELIDFNINDDCLTVDIGASGCDGETWSLVLVDSGNVAESSPEQRFLKLIFSNNETCLAVLSQTRVFNLSSLRVEGTNEILLNIEGIETPLSYMYP